MTLDALRRQWARVDWIEELWYLALSAMEACILYPWQAALLTWLELAPVPLWALVALMWVAYAVGSILTRSPLAHDRRQALTAGLLVVSALVYMRLFVYVDYPFGQLRWLGDMANSLFTINRIPPELVIILIAFISWWRGLAGSRKEYDTPTTWFHFRLGVVLMFIFHLASLLGFRTDTTVALLSFFFFGLIGISLARILELGGIHASSMSSRRWLAVLASSTVGSLLLGLLLTLLFSRQVLQTVLSWFRPLGRLLGRLAWYIMSIAFYLAVPLVEWIIAWFQQVRNRGDIERDLGNIQSPVSPVIPFEEVPGTYERFYPVCRTILIVLLIGGGLLLVTGLIRKLTQQATERQDLERESILSARGVLDDLRAALRERLNRLRDLAGQFGGRHRRSIASIRKLYASTVDLATEAGHPRRASETPYEYLDTLYAAFPDNRSAVEAITEAYVRTHYGQVPESMDEMDQLVRYWRELRDSANVKPRDESAAPGT